MTHDIAKAIEELTVEIVYDVAGAAQSKAVYSHKTLRRKVDKELLSGAMRKGNHEQ